MPRIEVLMPLDVFGPLMGKMVMGYDLEGREIRGRLLARDGVYLKIQAGTGPVEYIRRAQIARIREDGVHGD